MYKEFQPEMGVANAGARQSMGQSSSSPVMFRGRRGDLAIRILDITVALLAIMWLMPLLILVALLVKSSDGKQVLFAQPRIGRGGKMFRCLKFRTMVVDAEARLADLLENDPVARAEWERDHKLKNDPRIIPLGGFLRKWSLDELPQFFNVLRGDMSIVGPRPIVASEATKYGRYITTYHKNRPGITGLWQISGRNDVSYRRRIACDVVYTRSRSLLTDMRIIVMTAVVVLNARGSY